MEEYSIENHQEFGSFREKGVQAFNRLENGQQFSSFTERGSGFSTSTPLVHSKLDPLPSRSLIPGAWSPSDSKLDDALPPRTLPTFAWSPNDSGYADSLYSSSSGDSCQVTPNDSFTQFRVNNLDLSPSPTAVAQTSGSLQTDRYVPRFSLGVHLLDYEIPEEEQVYEKFSPDKSPIPHYSLEEEDEDMCTEDSGACAAPSLITEDSRACTAPSLLTEDSRACTAPSLITRDLGVCTAPFLTKQTVYANLTERFNAVLQQCMPGEPDRMIGRKMGLDRLDLISELSERGMTATIEKIVSYLQSSDIRRMCRVSKTWSSVCRRGSIQKQHRRIRPLKHKDKENVSLKLAPDLGPLRRGLTVGEHTTLGTVQAVQDRIPPLCSIGTQKDLFVQTAQSLKNEEKLTKCPMCQQPAIVYPVQERGVCQSEKCGFDYCVQCFRPYHKSVPCESLTVSKRSKESKIGGKHGKKFLRRL